jgi:hypothetical protein
VPPTAQSLANLYLRTVFVTASFKGRNNHFLEDGARPRVAGHVVTDCESPRPRARACDRRCS